MILYLFFLFGIITLFLLYTRFSTSNSDDVMARLERFTAPVVEKEIKAVSTQAAKHDIFDSLDERIAKAPLSVRIGQELVKADLPLRVTEYMAFRITIAFGLALLFFLMMGTLGAVLGGIVGWFVMPIYVKRKQAARQKKFAEQLESCLILSSSSLRAGYSFLQALALIADEQPDPAGKEFTRVMRETRIGMDLDESLSRLAERMESDDFDFVVTAVLIQRQTGGNLAEILDSIAATIRERVKLKQEIMTLTAMGRMSGGFISSLPFGLGAMFYFLNRESMVLLFTTWPGRAILGVAFLMIGLGMFTIKKVITIEV